MKATVFAAIDIGSYEVGMKIYELTTSKGIRELTYIRRRLELGKDTYLTGKIGSDRLQELIDVLGDYKQIMQEYGASDYRICATSAVRESESMVLLLDRIYVKTGLRVEVLSNSESRFLGYKSIAAQESDFDRIIQNGTAIIDVGGGSMQLSLFDKDALVSTQNIRIGTLRIKEQLSDVYERSGHFAEVVAEIMDNELKTYGKLYLKDRKIENIILIGDYITYISNYVNQENEKKRVMSAKAYQTFFKEMMKKTGAEILEILEIPSENEALIITTLVVYEKLIEETQALNVWIPGLNACDGLAFAYGESHKYLKSEHDFEKDIIAAATNISRRYHSNKNHVTVMSELALTIFDKTKNLHALGKRERLLLEIAVIMHDCGKYISMAQSARCSYDIIMATEIIGLSHAEREMVAQIVHFNSGEIEYYDEFSRHSGLNIEQYRVICKLASILRVSNAMDRSHKQKIKSIKVTLKEKELILTVDTMEDITLEKGLLNEKAEFFEEVYGVMPVLRKRGIGK